MTAVPPPRTAPPVPRIPPAPPPAPQRPPRPPHVPGQPRMARDQARDLKLLQDPLHRARRDRRGFATSRTSISVTPSRALRLDRLRHRGEDLVGLLDRFGNVPVVLHRLLHFRRPTGSRQVLRSEFAPEVRGRGGGEDHATSVPPQRGGTRPSLRRHTRVASGCRLLRRALEQTRPRLRARATCRPPRAVAA